VLLQEIISSLWLLFLSFIELRLGNSVPVRLLYYDRDITENSRVFCPSPQQNGISPFCVLRVNSIA
jgi:hypothetical protein